MQNIKVWDPMVRVFHWSLVIGFAANALIIEEESILHLWVGYIVVALITFRILWGFIGGKYARFSSFPPNLQDAQEQLSDMATGRKTVHIGHTPLGALMIYNLLFSLALVGLSGYLITVERFWLAEWPQELHEFAVTWTEISVVLHIIAVIYESKRTGVNLPKAMITGCKNLPKV